MWPISWFRPPSSRSRVIAASLYGVATGTLAIATLLYFFDDPEPGVTPALSVDGEGAQLSLSVPLSP